MLDSRPLHRLQHLLRLRRGAGQGLLADDVLPRLRGGDAGLGVDVVGAPVVEHLHGVVLEHLPPVGVGPGVPVAPGGLRDAGLVAPADRRQAGAGRGGPEHVGDLLVAVGVGLAHEGVAQHPDAHLRGLAGGARRPHGQEADLLRHCAAPLPGLKGGVERPPGGLEVDPPAERGGIPRPVLAVHPGVLPLHREGAVVADVVEGPDQLPEVDLSVPGGAELPPRRASPKLR